MAGKNPSSSSKPQPERANIITPLVQNSVMIHELDQVQPVRARVEDKVKLSRYVIQPRVEHGVAINIPEAQQLRRVEPPPIPVSVEQARLVGVAMDRVRVVQNVGQIVRNPPPVPTNTLRNGMSIQLHLLRSFVTRDYRKRTRISKCGCATVRVWL